MNSFFLKLTPRVPKQHLLLIAGIVWLLAGGMLLWRSLSYFEPIAGWPWFLAGAFLGGLLFFRGMFLRLSNKHITRINGMTNEYPCLFSFFNLRSYGIMVVMISGGIGLRASHILSLPYLSVFYLFMGIPLLLSSVRFVRAWMVNR